MFLIGRLVPADGDWLVSGNLSCYPSSARDQMLAIAAEQAMRNPEVVFRNPAKLAEARRMLAEHQAVFVGLFGSDLIVVPGDEVPGKVGAFYRRLRELAGPAAEQDEAGRPDFLDVPEILEAESVAIHFVEGEGLSFYPDYHLLEELFSNPALISRRRYRERLSDFLGDPDGSPEPLRRLAARDPAIASTVFARLLKRKRGFSWAADGEELLRRSKPRYFDGTVLAPDRPSVQDPVRRAPAQPLKPRRDARPFRARLPAGGVERQGSQAAWVSKPTEPKSWPGVRRTSASRAAARRRSSATVGSVPPSSMHSTSSTVMPARPASSATVIDRAVRRS
jgi:hypothetical protein